MSAEEEPPKGLNLKVCHSVAVGGAPTDGPVLRSALSPHTLHERPFGTNFQNIYSIFEAAAARRPSRPCFGTRFRADGSVGPFSWQTYEEVAARVQAFAAGLWQLHVVPASADGKRFVGLYMKNSPEWMVAAEACYRTGVCIVPMYDTLGPDTVGYIQRQTGMGTAICSANELPTLLKACPFADVIVAGPVAPALLAKCRAARIPVRTFSEVEAAGQAALPILASLPQPGPKDLALLCYTSGTTGDPKGAMLSHGNILAALSIQGFPGLPLLGADPEVQEIHLSCAAQFWRNSAQFWRNSLTAHPSPQVPPARPHLRDRRPQRRALPRRRRRLLPGRHAQDRRGPAGAAPDGLLVGAAAVQSDL